MKKLFAVIALFFAFTIGASAQEIKEDTPVVLAKKELHALSKVIELSNQTAIDINELLVYKHKITERFPNRKNELAEIVEGKLKGTLTEEQFIKIKNNKILFEDLIY